MTRLIEENIDYLEDVVANGGPSPDIYNSIAEAFSRLHAVCYREIDGLSEMVQPIHRLEGFLNANRDIFRSVETVQGFAWAKPRGYAGDFEIIERIYDRVVSDDPRLAPWDQFFHVSPGADAVRNRPAYIADILRGDRFESMLSLGCGGARDLAATNEGTLLRSITLVDTDADAIERARTNLTNPQIDYTFLNRNVFRLRDVGRFDIIWSAGLFDYLNEKRAIHLLNRVRDFMNDGARIVIGNFSKDHLSRPYMELVGEWRLIHRSEQEMADLMIAAGFDARTVTVESDETGVNLFANAVK